ncbi:hypothetical protein HYN69_13000 [Gemmobacter aquarius]|uniref:DUF6455 domain-containing protein n=1 Tax=Paragemmobacter aquarius TaxID=2169400 RepID=A0A2S0UND3_9RHOB|nr:DUF6455 family protein [Gemmobacter aquarius]AWB49300.1 hypothetical protein HYN69_13000 [Gemmobacter aquarius]
MIGYVEAPKAWGLTRGMARVLDVNLTDAVIDGWMSRSELSGLVDRCQGCGRDADCMGWLAHTAKAVALPEFCANKRALEALAAAQG